MCQIEFNYGKLNNMTLIRHHSIFRFYDKILQMTFSIFFVNFNNCYELFCQSLIQEEII